MMTPLPFSGLSLLIHLGIIVFAFFAGLLGYKRNPIRMQSSKGIHVAVLQTLKPIMSVMILGFVGFITALFILVAINTGIKSGANEPHRILIEEVMNAVKEGNIRSLLESKIEYRKTSPLYPFSSRLLS